MKPIHVAFVWHMHQPYMSGNLGGFRSSGLSTAAHGGITPIAISAGFEALLTFPVIGFTE
ncbi:MAG TPA: hypothetical protein VIO37_02125 [Candidatus Dormibacteraeota bacterium]|jgi:hypothetical protein